MILAVKTEGHKQHCLRQGVLVGAQQLKAVSYRVFSPKTQCYSARALA